MQPPDFKAEYAAALVSFLNERDEGALLRAASLGRRALAAGLGVLDVVNLHHTCLAPVLQDGASAEERRDAVNASAAFLCETLSCFEMTHRGFREISETITRIVRFAAVVCHELRTPLTSIVNSIGMLKELLNARSDSMEGRLLDNIVTSTDILKSRTDDLLDLVGFNSGTLSLKTEVIELGPLLSSLVARLTPEAERLGMRLRLEVAEGLPSLSADPGRLDQVVSNLLHNALKYAADGGLIDVRAYTRGRSVVIEVQDYGPGVSLWERMKIFQPNFRGSQVSRDIAGLGLGLALSRELVTQHRGHLELESQEGKGSIFRVELPLPRGAPGKGRAG